MEGGSTSFRIHEECRGYILTFGPFFCKELKVAGC
jgi:hypothetical protein